VIRALRAAAADGTLPAECCHAWLDRGMSLDEVFLKLVVAIPPDWLTYTPWTVSDAVAAAFFDTVIADLLGSSE
jgi:hypothetical protein